VNPDTRPANRLGGFHDGPLLQVAEELGRNMGKTVKTAVTVPCWPGFQLCGRSSMTPPSGCRNHFLFRPLSTSGVIGVVQHRVQ
jgi:hypothetical protein